MATRSDPVDDGESIAAVEPDVDESALVLAVSGADMFVSASKSRRVQLPASLRRGRHGARDARKRHRASNGEGEKSHELHLVEVDGQAETERIALRRRFEEISAVEPSWGEHSGTELEQSVAG